MFGFIALACFDAAGIAFMLYVLVNVRRDLKRGRDKNRNHRSTRIAGRTKTLNSIPTVTYSAHPEFSAPQAVLRRSSR